MVYPVCDHVKHHLKIDRQQRRMPVIGNVHKVVVAIVHASTGHMPHSLQGSFAQEGTSEGNLHPVPAIYVLPEVVETGVVHEYMVHAIYIAMEVSNLQQIELANDMLGCHANPIRTALRHGFAVCFKFMVNLLPWLLALNRSLAVT